MSHLLASGLPFNIQCGNTRGWGRRHVGGHIPFRLVRTPSKNTLFRFMYTAHCYRNCVVMLDLKDVRHRRQNSDLICLNSYFERGIHSQVSGHWHKLRLDDIQ
jgi:hypothetical protein